MLDRQALIEEELHDLKLRFELLDGDRKAYLETSQNVMRLNKEEMAKLRNLNKELRDAIGKLKKPGHYEKPEGGTSELDRFDMRISELHKKHDDMQAMVRDKDDRMQELEDQLNELVVEHHLIQQAAEESAESKAAHALENRLDKAIIKFNETQSIRKVYDEIVKRLQEERLTFDIQLAHFDRTLHQKKLDAAELEVMSRDANHAKELAKTELARIEERIAEDRKTREKDLALRKELVRQKIETNESLEQKLLRTAAAPDDSRQLMGEESTMLAADEKAAEYEQLSRTIKEAIGVNDLNDVVAKFQEQSVTHNRLTQLAQTNEHKLNELKRKRSEMMKELEEMLVGGEARGQHARTVLHELETRLDQEFTLSEEAVAKYERVVKVLTSARTGIFHLRMLLEDEAAPVHPGGGGGGAAGFSNNTSPAALVEALDVSSKRIDDILASINGREIRIEGELSSVTLQHQFSNVRVHLRPVTFDPETDEENDTADDDDVVLDRDSIKKSTQALLNAKNKPKQANGGGGGGGGGNASGKKKKKTKKGQESDPEESDG
ncbi:hypothetical protein RI367_006203 [Sorochytrium milnesiophthora]